ncbi:hypothetical protein BA065_01165 [Nanoarchaeota archaeon NZ13-N]|nr:MAG: hypothetical protein BA065_01165 [Nanoarchaeota archaeon NZ13-N]
MEKAWVFIAIGLLLGEGHFGKKEYRNQGRIVFSNTNPVYVRLVYKLFTEFFNVPKNKIKVYIYYNLNYYKLVEEIRMFWSRSLKIPDEYIRIYTYKRDIKRITRQSERWGICQLRIDDVNIKDRIENFLSSLFQKYYIEG